MDSVRRVGHKQLATSLTWMVCLMTVVAVAGCDGCSKESPPVIDILRKDGWTVRQTADLLEVSKAECTDDDLKTLAQYAKDVKTLHLDISNSKVTDAGLASVKSLTNVARLLASKLDITARGLASISSWARLESLDLSETKVDDGGLEHLKDLASLQSLELRKCPITGAGLANLAQLRKLDRLRLDGAQIDDAGLEALPVLDSLLTLGLNETKITEASIPRLKKFAGLEEIWLENVEGITDEALDAWQEENKDLLINF